MKIDNVSHLPAAGRVDQNKNGEKIANATQKSDLGAESTTHLSHVSGDASQDIDPARVADLRQAISEGRLKVDTDRIADRLIASARDLLGTEK